MANKMALEAPLWNRNYFYGIEGHKQGVAEVFFSIEVAVVSGVFPCVPPNPFCGIQLGVIGRKVEVFNVFPIASKPILNFRLFVIRCIVLD